MKYAVFSNDKNINVFKDGRSFKTLAYAKKVCLNMMDYLDDDSLYVKSIKAENLKDIADKRKETIQRAVKIIKRVYRDNNKLRKENKMMRECLESIADTSYITGGIAREVLNKLKENER